MLSNPVFLSHNNTSPYLLPGVSTTRCLSCLCGHVVFTVNISLVDLGLCLRGYKCGRECDRMCECVNSTMKVNTCIYNRSSPRESWPRFSLLARHLPLKIIYTAFLWLLYSLIMRSRVMCFFLNSRETTNIWENFRNVYELFYIQSVLYTFVDKITSVKLVVFHRYKNL